MIYETQIWDILESSFTSHNMAKAAYEPQAYQQLCSKVLESMTHINEDFVQAIVTDVVLSYNPCAALTEVALLLHRLK